MVVSKIYITEEYREKVDDLLKDVNVFELDEFFRHHTFEDYENATPDNVRDHDIFIIDETTFDVFIEHWSQYFSGEAQT